MESDDRRQITERLQARRIKTFQRGVRWILMRWDDQGFWFPYYDNGAPAVSTKSERQTGSMRVRQFPSPSHAETFARSHGLI